MQERHDTDRAAGRRRSSRPRHRGLAMARIGQTTVVALLVVLGISVSARAAPTPRAPASLSPAPGLPASHALWTPPPEAGHAGATSQGARAASQEVREILAELKASLKV